MYELKANNYNPHQYYESNPKLKKVMDMIGNGYFSPADKKLFKPIFDSLVL